MYRTQVTPRHTQVLCVNRATAPAWLAHDACPDALRCQLISFSTVLPSCQVSNADARRPITSHVSRYAFYQISRYATKKSRVQFALTALWALILVFYFSCILKGRTNNFTVPTSTAFGQRGEGAYGIGRPVQERG